jgi:Mce-associated membrane protein
VVTMTKDDVDSTSDAEADKVDEKDAADTSAETDPTEADDVDAAEESDSDAPKADDDADSSGTSSWVRYAAIGAFAAILVGALVFSGVVGMKVWRQHQIDAAGEQAQAVAVAYTEVLTSVESDKIDENFRQILNGATGKFKDDFTQASIQLRQLLIDNKSGAEGKVVNSAIESKSTDKVVILMMVDQSVKNVNVRDQRVDKNRMKITMVKIDGRWLASDLTYL